MKNNLIYYLFITLSIIVNSCTEGFKEEYSKINIVLAEVTAITTPTTNTTPVYTFSSTDSGAITYGGSCSSSTTSAISGNNTITLSSLSERTYADCTITVSKTISTENSETNLSDSLTITSFTVSSSDDSSSSGSGVFVAVGDSGTIVRSTDNGETWDNATSPTANSLYEATFGNNTFVAVGLSGNIVRSTDNGETWDNETSGTSLHLYGVTYGNNTFVAVGEIGNIRTSSDGSSWTHRTKPQSYNLMGATFGNNTFVAVGYNGSIVRSTDN